MIDQSYQFNVLGFDMDETLAQYRVPTLVNYIFTNQIKFLVNERHYPMVLSQIHVEDHASFCARGFILDIEKGVLVMLDKKGVIRSAHQNGRPLSEIEVKNLYGQSMIPDFYENLRENYRNSERVHIFDDIFTVQCVPILNELFRLRHDNKLPEKTTHRQVWNDVLESLYHVYGDKEGCYYSVAPKRLADFIHRSHPHLLEKIKFLKHKKGIKFFILTSSTHTYAEKVLSHIFEDHENWEDVFELILFDARKPHFFTKYSEFLTCEAIPRPTKTPDMGKKYSQGCYELLQQWLAKLIPDPKVLYFGDSLQSDVHPISTRTQWKVCGIANELNSDFHYGKNSEHWQSCMAFMDGSHSLWYDLFDDHSHKVGKNVIDLLEEIHPPLQD
ncbi:5'-nucleotidase domain containing 1 [Cichlidogyrus casuarinus]|uniref:5'-nucleotidase domain containing 1 n=1 Tax=Cichlidogyrus casuarinus TaxID=1844966 RepID=A0ABD2QCS6_9PLAT